MKFYEKLSLNERTLKTAQEDMEKITKKLKEELMNKIECYLEENSEYHFKSVYVNSEEITVRYNYEDSFTYNFNENTIYFDKTSTTINFEILSKMIKIIHDVFEQEV